MSNPLFGTCSSCGPNPSPGWTCTGSVQLGSTGAYADLDFGSQSAGKYQAQYCGGAWVFDGSRGDKWTVNTASLGDTNEPSFIVIHSPKQSTESYCDGVGYPVGPGISTVTLKVPAHGMTSGQPIVIYSSPAGTWDLTTTTAPEPVIVTVIDADHISFPAGFAHGQVLLADTSNTVWQASFLSQPTPTNTAPYEWAYTSQALAEAAFLCSGTTITHLGGHVKILYRDSNYIGTPLFFTDANADGSPNPIFGLYFVTPEFVFNDACGDWTTKGTAAEVSISINNTNAVTWYNVTATLLGTGGVSGASSPPLVSGVPFSGTLSPGLTSFYFTFNASTANVTGTLRLTSPDWTGNVDISWYMGPVYTSVAVADLGGTVTCGGHNIRYFGMTFTNTGFWKTDPLVACSFTGSGNLHFVDGSCVDQSTQSVQTGPGLVNCESTGTDSDDYFRMRSNSGTNVAHVTMVVTDAGWTIGTYTADVSVAH